MTYATVFRAELWEHDGPASWYFLSVPTDIADEIESRFGAAAKGFGSIRVEVTVGATTWRTSLFPDSARRTYLLPVKQAVRKAEGLVPGEAIDIALTVLVEDPLS